MTVEPEAVPGRLADAAPLPPPSHTATDSARPARSATSEPLGPGGTAGDVRRLASHAATVLVVQILLVILDASWARDILAGAPWREAARGATAPDGYPGLLHSIGRLWLVLLALDVVYTLTRRLARFRSGRGHRGEPGPGRDVT